MFVCMYVLESDMCVCMYVCMYVLESELLKHVHEKEDLIHQSVCVRACVCVCLQGVK